MSRCVWWTTVLTLGVLALVPAARGDDLVNISITTADGDPDKITYRVGDVVRLKVRVRNLEGPDPFQANIRVTYGNDEVCHEQEDLSVPRGESSEVVVTCTARASRYFKAELTNPPEGDDRYNFARIKILLNKEEPKDEDEDPGGGGGGGAAEQLDQGAPRPDFKIVELIHPTQADTADHVALVVRVKNIGDLEGAGTLRVFGEQIGVRPTGDDGSPGGGMVPMGHHSPPTGRPPGDDQPDGAGGSPAGVTNTTIAVFGNHQEVRLAPDETKDLVVICSLAKGEINAVLDVPRDRDTSNNIDHAEVTIVNPSWFGEHPSHAVDLAIERFLPADGEELVIDEEGRALAIVRIVNKGSDASTFTIVHTVTDGGRCEIPGAASLNAYALTSRQRLLVAICCEPTEASTLFPGIRVERDMDQRNNSLRPGIRFKREPEQ